MAIKLNKVVLFNELRSPLFGGKIAQAQVDSTEAILAELEREQVTDLNMVAYVLATAWHEARLRPVREGFASSDAEARRVVAHRPYGKVVNGHVYYGRGLVQLTWFDNYKKWGIASTPDKALEPAFAAHVLVQGMLKGSFNKGGTGPGLAHYLDRPKPDWKGARRTVNITDRWEMIRDYALLIRRALEISQAMYDDTKPSVNEQGKSDRVADGKGALESTTILSTIGSWLLTNGTLVIGLAKEQPVLVGVVLVVSAIAAAWVIRERLKKSERYGV